VVTSQDLCWQDTVTCRVDVRVFDRERVAAVTAAADDDTERVRYSYRGNYDRLARIKGATTRTTPDPAGLVHRLSVAADRRPGR
jgi:hypothetical protein